MMKKMWIYVGGALIVLALSGYLLFARKGGGKYEFRFDKVSQGDLTVNVTATGTINAVTTVDVGTQVSGIISRLYADFNSIVKEGQVIAQIDPTFLQQSVKDAQANLERTKAQYADSKRVLERTKALYEKNLESQVNYDAALTSFESNQAGLKQAQATLDRAKINLAYATIYAPINGVVIDRKVNVGQTVAASFSSPTLFTIANDLSKMQVQTTVDESDIGSVTIGQKASFTVDAYPEEKFSGRVSQIRLAPITVQNVVNYTVIIDVNNDQLKLMPGMTANVQIQAASKNNVLRVPNMALRFQPPSDLIDTTRVNELREAFASRGSAGQDSSHGSLAEGATEAHAGARSGESPQEQGAGGPEGRRAGLPDSEGRSNRIQALRDSILAAHGGQLSKEELMQEMQKASRRTQTGGREKPAAGVQFSARAGSGTRFGITARFPEYQKSSASSREQSGRGRVWILNAKGKLEPVFVHTGLNDGKFTEISSTAFKPGDQVVLGATSNSDSGQDQARSPLTPSGPGPMGGGRR